MAALDFVKATIAPLALTVVEKGQAPQVGGERIVASVESSGQASRSLADYWEQYQAELEIHTPGVRDDTRLQDLVGRLKNLLVGARTGQYQCVWNSFTVIFNELENNDRIATLAFTVRERVDYP